MQKWFKARKLPLAAISSVQMIYDFFWWFVQDVKHLKTGSLMVTRSFKWIKRLAYYHGYVTQAEWPGYRHDEEFDRIRAANDRNHRQLVLRTGNKRTHAERTAMKLSDINKIADDLAWGQSSADDIIQLMSFISVQTQTLMRPPQMCDVLRMNLRLQNPDNYMSLAGGVQVLEMGSNEHKITDADTYHYALPMLKIDCKDPVFWLGVALVHDHNRMRDPSTTDGAGGTLTQLMRSDKKGGICACTKGVCACIEGCPEVYIHWPAVNIEIPSAVDPLNVTSRFEVSEWQFIPAFRGRTLRAVVEVEGTPFKHTDPDEITERLLIPMMQKLGIKSSKKGVKTLIVRQTMIGHLTVQFSGGHVFLCEAGLHILMAYLCVQCACSGTGEAETGDSSCGG